MYDDVMVRIPNNPSVKIRFCNSDDLKKRQRCHQYNKRAVTDPECEHYEDWYDQYSKGGGFCNLNQESKYV